MINRFSLEFNLTYFHLAETFFIVYTVKKIIPV